MRPRARGLGGPVGKPASRRAVYLVGVGALLLPLTLNNVRATDSDLTYPLQAQQSGVSATGMNTLCLPYTRKSCLDTASDLLDDIEVYGGTGSVVQISRFIRSTDAVLTYTGSSLDTNFNLNDGEGYRVQITGSSFNYEIEGDHDLNQTIKLYKAGAPIGEPSGEGNSESGIAKYCPPYYAADAWTSDDLRDEIELVTADSVNDIWRFVKSSDTYQSGSFSLVAGEYYRIQMDENVEFTPEPDPAWLSEWICEQAEPEPLVADNLGRLLQVTAYQGVPGCVFGDGSEILVANLATHLSFQVDYAATFENDQGSGGPATCDDGTGENGCSGSFCVGQDSCPNDPSSCLQCEGACEDCICCAEEDDIQLLPVGTPGGGHTSSASCGLPHCNAGEIPGEGCIDNPGCDNGSQCSCEYHCTKLKTGSLVVTVDAFKCVGDSEWTYFSSAETWDGVVNHVAHPSQAPWLNCSDVPTCP